MTLMIYLNQPILQLNEAYKEILGKGSGWIIDSVIDHNFTVKFFNWQELYKINKRIRPSKERID